MTRVGAIDIGTNSTRLLIADVEGDRLTALDRRSAVTRLGEGVDADRALRPEAMERVRVVLDDYASAVCAAGAERTLAVATSAARDAVNGAAFLNDIAANYGFTTRILSGEQEATLTRRGVGATDPDTLLVDIGGGSTELIWNDQQVSLEMGSVRLTERYLHSDPPTGAELEAAKAFARSLLPELHVERAVGVAGTVTQLHVIVGDLTVAAATEALDHLAALPLAERQLVPGMDPARAPVIVGGAIIVIEILRRYRLAELAWSVNDLLDGIAFEAAGTT